MINIFPRCLFYRKTWKQLNFCVSQCVLSLWKIPEKNNFRRANYILAHRCKGFSVSWWGGCDGLIGTCPPGTHPSEAWPPRICPSGTHPSDTWPSGMWPSGTWPPGACPSGTCPSGAWQPGTCPPGTCPSGSRDNARALWIFPAFPFIPIKHPDYSLALPKFRMSSPQLILSEDSLTNAVSYVLINMIKAGTKTNHHQYSYK